MRLLLLILISLSWLLVLPAARAQWLTADDFFNDGAHSYISNNIPQALQSVQNGLQRYPDDEKLKKLYELLKQQQKQHSNNNNKTSKINRKKISSRIPVSKTSNKINKTSRIKIKASKNSRNRIRRIRIKTARKPGKPTANRKRPGLLK